MDSQQWKPHASTIFTRDGVAVTIEDSDSGHAVEINFVSTDDAVKITPTISVSRDFTRRTERV